jgi:predicted transcriptional regulator
MTLKQRRKFTPEFNSKSWQRSPLVNLLPRRPASTNFIRLSSDAGRSNIVSMRIAPSPAMVVLTQMKLASLNSNAWLAASRWKTTC